MAVIKSWEQSGLVSSKEGLGEIQAEHVEGEWQAGTGYSKRLRSSFYSMHLSNSWDKYLLGEGYCIPRSCLSAREQRVSLGLFQPSTSVVLASYEERIFNRVFFKDVWSHTPLKKQVLNNNVGHGWVVIQATVWEFLLAAGQNYNQRHSFNTALLPVLT